MNILGLILLVVGVVFCFLGFSDPSDHPKRSHETNVVFSSLGAVLVVVGITLIISVFYP
jgi:hypothetical protein